MHKSKSHLTLLEPGHKEAAMQVRDRMQKIEYSVRDKDDVQSAEQLMHDKHVTAVAVKGANGKLVGILTVEDLAALPPSEISKALNLSQIRVSHLMSQDVTTVEPDATLKEAAGLLLDKGFRHLPVVDERNTLLGILSERDVRMVLGTELKDFLKAARGLEAPVSSVMNPNPTALRPDMRMIDALDAFTDERVGAVPVLDEEEHLVGILSYIDVLVWLSRHASTP